MQRKFCTGGQGRFSVSRACGPVTLCACWFPIWGGIQGGHCPSKAPRSQRLPTLDQFQSFSLNIFYGLQPLRGVLEAISNGMFHASMKGKMDTLEARKAELDTMLAQAAAEEPIILHPALADVYSGMVKALVSSLDDEATKAEAIELLRSLVAEVRLYPDDDAPDGHMIELYGELAAILELSGPTNDGPHRITGGVSVSLVAGVGFEPTTFRL